MIMELLKNNLYKTDELWKSVLGECFAEETKKYYIILNNGVLFSG